MAFSKVDSQSAEKECFGVSERLPVGMFRPKRNPNERYFGGVQNVVGDRASEVTLSWKDLCLLDSLIDLVPTTKPFKHLEIEATWVRVCTQ